MKEFWPFTEKFVDPCSRSEILKMRAGNPGWGKGRVPETLSFL